MKLHSIVNLITNSSTEIFVIKNFDVEDAQILFDKSFSCEFCPIKVEDFIFQEGKEIFNYSDPADYYIAHPSDTVLVLRTWQSGVPKYTMEKVLNNIFGESNIDSDSI